MDYVFHWLLLEIQDVGGQFKLWCTDIFTGVRIGRNANKWAEMFDRISFRIKKYGLSFLESPQATDIDRSKSSNSPHVEHVDGFIGERREDNTNKKIMPENSQKKPSDLILWRNEQKNAGWGFCYIKRIKGMESNRKLEGTKKTRLSHVQ